MISRALDYALRACLYMANRPEQEFFNVGELASHMEMSRTYLGKVLQKLVHVGYLRSLTGPTGGFALAEGTLQLTLLDIVKVLDGPDPLSPCVLGMSACNDKNPCPVHNTWLKSKADLLARMANTTLAEAGKTSWPTYMRQNGAKGALSRSK